MTALLGLVLVMLGVGFLVLPLHMGMTGAVFLLLGAAALLCCFLRRRGHCALADGLTVAAAGCVVLLMAAMSLISCYGGGTDARAQDGEYVLVLGSGVNEDGSPSRIMEQRIFAVLEFMEENPAATVILTGGQGAYEPVSEAECMYQTMVSCGADPGRLLLEENSTTTRENLLYGMELIEAMGGTDAPVGLVTSEFHQRRANYLAASLGISTFPIPADTDRWFYRINYTLREVFAFVKAAFVDF